MMTKMVIKYNYKKEKIMKIIIQNTNDQKYFEKTMGSTYAHWRFVNTAPAYPGIPELKMTDEVSDALDTIFNTTNPEQEDEIYYDFDRDRNDNEDEEIIVLDWLEW